MLPFDEQFTEPVIGATAAKAHFVRTAAILLPMSRRVTFATSANGCFEPKVTDAAVCANDSFSRLTVFRRINRVAFQTIQFLTLWPNPFVRSSWRVHWLYPLRMGRT